MNSTKCLLLVLILSVSGVACSDGGSSLPADGSTTDVEDEAGAPTWTCDQAATEWQGRIAEAAASHAACSTAADCKALWFSLDCDVGYEVALPSCPEPVSVDGEAAAKSDLAAEMAEFCSHVPEGCLFAPKCACVGTGCQVETLACVEGNCRMAEVVLFSEIAFVPTERPEVTGSDWAAAFVPAWCSSESEGPSDSCDCYTLDCPALATQWPCSDFAPPLPFTAALSPQRPLLRRQVVESQTNPAHPECQCSGGLREYAWSGLGPFSVDGGMYRTCTSLIALIDGQPQVVDSPEALRQAFAPVETPAEALAFVTVLGVGAPERGELVHAFEASSWQALGPYSVDAPHACLDEPVQGTRVTAVEGGFRVVTFAPDAVCEPDFVNEVTLFVSTTGEVTLESRRTICWYEDYLCVE